MLDCMVLSSIFRKFDSEKMKLCAGKPGEGAAKPRLIAAEHMTAAVSGEAKPFILTLDSAGGICYLVAALMPLLLRLQSNISCKDIVCCPHSFPETYRSLAQTSMRADFPSGNVPTTLVLRRISRFIRSMTLFVRIFSQCCDGKSM